MLAYFELTVDVHTYEGKTALPVETKKKKSISISFGISEKSKIGHAKVGGMSGDEIPNGKD